MPLTINAASSTISQYEESPLLLSFMDALASELSLLHQVINDVQLKRYLNNATGVQLDIIGELVGVNRTIVDGILLFFFGFEGDASALTFGDLNDPAIGGRYRSSDEGVGSTRFLTDEEFRIYITGRISTNVSRCTGNDVLSATAFFFNVIDGSAPKVTVQDENMMFFVYVDRVLSTTEKVLLDQLNLIPKSIGVRMGFTGYDLNNMAVWDNATIYEFGNLVVASDTSNYVSISANNIGNDPISSPNDWILSAIN